MILPKLWLLILNLFLSYDLPQSLSHSHQPQIHSHDHALHWVIVKQYTLSVISISILPLSDPISYFSVSLLVHEFQQVLNPTEPLIHCDPTTFYCSSTPCGFNVLVFQVRPLVHLCTRSLTLGKTQPWLNPVLYSLLSSSKAADCDWRRTHNCADWPYCKCKSTKL